MFSASPSMSKLGGAGDVRQSRCRVAHVALDPLTWSGAVSMITAFAQDRRSSVVCMVNAHSVVTASRDDSFGVILADSDVCAPDGAPVSWVMRRLGVTGQRRIDGPGLLWRYCAYAAGAGDAVYLYGGAPDVMVRLTERLALAFPKLIVAGAECPPFRPLIREEDDAAVERINASGATVLFVSLGCPKQERWMHEHRGRINAVMIGVGAAFDYHAGTLRRAPEWMQRIGLEWAFRLAMEPRRLWKRYLVTNTWFIMLAGRQLAGHWLRRGAARWRSGR